jgi:hypothetical protein
MTMSYSREQYAVLAALQNAVADSRLPIDTDTHGIVEAWSHAVKLRADARALWSLRVLDAHLATGGDVDLACLGEGRAKAGDWDLELHDSSGQYTHAFTERTPDAARHAAALAVFPTLPAEVQARLGKSP